MKSKIIRTSPDRKRFVRARNFCFLLMGILMILFRRSHHSSGSLGTMLFGKYALEIGEVLLLPAIVLGIVFHFISRRKQILGKLMMTAETITIEQADKTLDFKISDITGLNIKQGQSDVSKEMVVMMSSYDNWLSFVHHNLNYEYQFTIDSSYASRQLADLLAIWKQHGYLFLVEEVK